MNVEKGLSLKIKLVATVSLMNVAVLLVCDAQASAPPDTSLIPLEKYQSGLIMLRLSPSAVASPEFLLAPPIQSAPHTGLEEVDSVLDMYAVTEVYRRKNLPQDGGLTSQFGLDRDFRCVISDSVDIDSVCVSLNALQDVIFAEPNYLLAPGTAPDDSLYSRQWGHNNTRQFKPCFSQCLFGTPIPDCLCRHEQSINDVGTVGFDADVDSAWNLIGSFGDASIRIAVFDTGADSDHPDLNLAPGYNASDSSQNTEDLDPRGHGTRVSGIIGATVNNGIGIAGVAGGCTIVPVRVNDDEVSGAPLTTRMVERGLIWAIDNDIHVVNMSILGQPFSESLENCIEAAHTAEITMISITGNFNCSEILYPGAYDNTIAVGAASPCGERKRGTNQAGCFGCPGAILGDPEACGLDSVFDYSCDGEWTWGSNWGDGIDFLAPSMLPTTDNDGGYFLYFNGTSSAAPFVSGVAGLVLSHNPTLNPDKVRQILQAGCVDIAEGKGHATTGYDIYTGHGMINAFNSVKLARVTEAPVDLTLENYSNSQQRVRLTWPDNSLVEDNWVIERKETSDSSWQVVATVGPNETDSVAFDDNTTDGSQSYDYRVLPVGHMSPLGIYSPVRTITTPPRWPDNASASVIEIEGNCFGGLGPIGGGIQQSSSGPGPIPVFEKTDMIIINWSAPAMQALEINHYFYQRIDLPDTTGPFYENLTTTLDTNCAALYSNYTFRIWSVDTAGDTSLPFITGTVSTGCWPLCPTSPPFKSVSDATPPLPYTTELIGAFPNPFNPETKITYSLAQSSHVSLTVYNILGQQVVTLIDQDQDAGLHSVIWNSRSSTGSQVSSGIYFTRFKTESFVQSKKMLLLK